MAASNDSSTSSSLDQSSVIASSEPASSNSDSASSSLSSEEGEKYFRVTPTVSSSDVSDVYNVAFEDGKYVGTKITAISEDNDCLNYQDVCLYYEAFRQFPPNYKTTNKAAISYGVNGRLVSHYNKASYHSSNDYTVKLGTFNDATAGDYYELDIDLDGTYNNGGSLTRGAGRVVIVADGLTDYGTEPVCFYTYDHYADFVEFYNFYEGWSPLFEGVENSSGSYHDVPTTDLARPIPVTVAVTA